MCTMRMLFCCADTGWVCKSFKKKESTCRQFCVWELSWSNVQRSRIYYQIYRDVAKDRKLILIDNYPNWENGSKSLQEVYF